MALNLLVLTEIFSLFFKSIWSKMPVRKIPKSYRSVTGLIVSKKNQRMSGFESSLERDSICLLEFDLNVDYYEEQPVTIDYIDREGKEHTYTPDVFVSYRRDIIPMHINLRKASISKKVGYRKKKSW